MARREKSIWEQAVTFHVTVPQKENFILVELAKDMNVPIKRVLSMLIKESETFAKKARELENKGYFI